MTVESRGLATSFEKLKAFYLYYHNTLGHQKRSSHIESYVILQSSGFVGSQGLSPINSYNPRNIWSNEVT